jgi:hypothetical protein
MGAGAEGATVERIAASRVQPPADKPGHLAAAQPTAAEAAYLRPGLTQPGRKLPLFDRHGRPVRAQVILVCLARGWAERWFANPLAPEWMVCRLTDKGVEALER